MSERCHVNNNSPCFGGRFPKSSARLKLWALAVNRAGYRGTLWQPSTHSLLCSEHFSADCFDRTGCTVRLRENAIPTIFTRVKTFPVPIREDPETRSSEKSVAKKRVIGTAVQASTEETWIQQDHTYSLPDATQLRLQLGIMRKTSLPPQEHCSLSPSNHGDSPRHPEIHQIP